MTESSDALASLPATPRLPSPRVSRYTDQATVANTLWQQCAAAFMGGEARSW